MKYLSVCSGIEAATVAWHPLGWEPLAFCEIEKFPSAVLNHHYPTTPNYGDFTKYRDWPIKPGDVQLLVGGTPCQAFSVAGLRRSLDDARGNLSLTFCKLADHYDPEWIIWENVPGVLSTKDNAFGCFLAGLCGESDPIACDGKWPNAGVVSGPKRTVAWRVLDAQYFGVAQRRRRVFAVAVRGAGNWASAAALFPVSESVFWDSAPSRKTRQGASRGIEIGPSGCRFTELNPTLDTRAKDGPVRNQLAGAVLEPLFCAATGQAATEILRDMCPTLNCNHEAPYVAHTLRGEGYDAGEDGSGRGTPLVAVHGSQDPCVTVEHSHPVGRNNGLESCANQRGVRRLTPTECERLQGFPDDYTAVQWGKLSAEKCPDGPRYKALGNSMAVPCMAWLGKRIELVQQINQKFAQ